MLHPSTAIAAPALAAQGLSRGSSSSIDVVVWAGILMVAVVGGGMLVMYLRRRLLAKDGGGAGGGLMLADLRAMHKRGELSDDEFQAAKDAITAKLSGKPPPPRPAPSPVRGDGALTAPPGFDLLGRPLPRPAGEGGSPMPPRSTPPRSGGGGGGGSGASGGGAGGPGGPAGRR